MSSVSAFMQFAGRCSVLKKGVAMGNRNWLLGLVSALALVGCGRDSSLLYYYTDPQLDEMAGATATTSSMVSEIRSRGVDVLWVIDNSGSMSTHQQNVIKNTKLFMDELTQIKFLKWNMALLSSDLSEVPYLGMGPGGYFGWTSNNPVKVFQDAVGKLGTNGSATEQFFDPIEKQLNAYPGFIKSNPDNVLALIFVTDAVEQSDKYDGAQFVKYLDRVKGSRDNWVAYGGFAAEDLGFLPCDADSSEWNYSSSEYRTVIEASKGKMMSLCDPQFGKRLAEFGNDLVSRVKKPRVLLKDRPRLSTLRVFFSGKELKGGPANLGGVWNYDPENNAIVFESLDFVSGASESAKVDVRFVRDTGFDVPGRPQ
jgi:hypothetical protein